MKKKAIIIGAGPAGLTAAYELLKRTDIIPVILEKSSDIGGISKTVNYKGNRIDIGGHRFFSKSDRVMNWWMNIMPVQQTDDTYTTITYQRNHRTIIQEESHPRGNGTDESKTMLIRKRLSRIYFLRKFFTYPIQLSIDTLQKLGLARTLGILASYTKAQLFPRKPEKSLEDFLINRFGVKLYHLFFKDYTEKVWGVPCNEISAEWGAQRIKGVSISKAIQHAAKMIVQKKKGNDISQKGTETSLIEQFLYPALGPGQLWEEVARQVKEMGGEIMMHQNVKEIQIDNNKVTSVVTENSITDEITEYKGDYFFSTMPVQELIAGMREAEGGDTGAIPQDVKEVAAGLQYRDFITVGVLLKKLTPPDKNTENKNILPDTWIYIQEKDVKVGRLQIFNNWSPYMVKDADTVWIGMEYFCNTTDEFWQLTDAEIQRVGISELEKMGLAKVEDVLDSTVLRMEKTYPAYFGTYNQFEEIKNYTDKFKNLFLVGRNGMHKYNNSDHSMLTAMVSVDNICAGIITKENIWTINTEQEYHEEKAKEKTTTSNAQTAKSDKENQDDDFGYGQNKQRILNSPRAKHNSEHRNNKSELTLTFKRFVFQTKQNRTLLWLAAIAIVLQFAIFKYLYPFASYIHGDSFAYLTMAKENSDINIYPIGYPRFLRLFNIFISSDTALTWFQYLIIQSSALFMLFTILFFYKPAKSVQWILWTFIVFNPLFWYMGNLVSSDAIFLALSLTWFGLLLWIIHMPSNKIIAIHALILFLAFTVRYNALIYPIIATIAFYLSPLQWYRKVAGLAAVVLLCCVFILYTGNKYKQLTGIWQFSPFSGWQLANNAMYAYRYVDSAERKPVPQKFKAIDMVIRKYFDTHRDTKKYPAENTQASTVYMWTRGMPLQKYMEEQFAKDKNVTALKKWASVAPLYSAYGTFLIKSYPAAFFANYLWPNARKYYAPPLEFLEHYNMGKDSVTSEAQAWFGYKSRKVTSRLRHSDADILGFYPILTGAINMVFLAGLVCFILLSGYREKTNFRQLMIIATVVWLLNAGFTIFASPAALRFQSFPIILVTLFIALMSDWMMKLIKQITIKKVTTGTQLESNIPTKSLA